MRVSLNVVSAPPMCPGALSSLTNIVEFAPQLTNEILIISFLQKDNRNPLRTVNVKNHNVYALFSNL